MQRAILLLALVACAQAQLFQQVYDWRDSFVYAQPGSATPGDGVAGAEFSGALRFTLPPEFREAVRFSATYTQTVRPANGYVVLVDPHSSTTFNSFSRVTLHDNYLVVAASSEHSEFEEGDVVLVNGNDASLPCFGAADTVLFLNSPVPNAQSVSDVPGTRACLVNEGNVIAKVSFKASRSEASALGLENFRYVRRDRTLFGPTVFSSEF